MFNEYSTNVNSDWSNAMEYFRRDSIGQGVKNLCFPQNKRTILRRVLLSNWCGHVNNSLHQSIDFPLTTHFYFGRTATCLFSSVPSQSLPAVSTLMTWQVRRRALSVQGHPATWRLRKPPWDRSVSSDSRSPLDVPRNNRAKKGSWWETIDRCWPLPAPPAGADWKIDSKIH